MGDRLMGGCMSWPRMVNRNQLAGTYGDHNGAIAGDLRRVERDQRDARHLDRYATAASIAPEQARAVLDLFFDLDCEGQGGVKWPEERHSMAEHRLSPAGISPREREILMLSATGLTRSDIADRLYCAEETVQVHLSRLYARWGARNRIHALALAVANGVIIAADLSAGLKMSDA